MAFSVKDKKSNCLIFVDYAVKLFELSRFNLWVLPIRIGNIYIWQIMVMN